MTNYIEFCAGAGGMRAGVDAAGWKCILAIDNDPDAVAVHGLAHGDATCADVADLVPSSLPDADAWVAGFPCQPFSTSGHRAGFGHRSGNVFEHLVRLAEAKKPPLILLENVGGLLSNKSGHTFSIILLKLTALGYRVDWLVADLRWFGAPQTRPRLFVVAAKAGVLDTPLQFKESESEPNWGDPGGRLFGGLLIKKKLTWVRRGAGSLSALSRSLEPAIGKPRHAGPRVFGAIGHAVSDAYATYDVREPSWPVPKPSLAAVVAPAFSRPEEIRSGRYYARGGPTRLCVREELISHCVGTSLGGAPLYAVPLGAVRTASDRTAFLEYSNWHREQDDMLVMRLRPERAVVLFGPHTNHLREAVGKWRAGDTRKYVLVGNMVAPVVAATVVGLINDRLQAIGGNPRTARSVHAARAK